MNRPGASSSSKSKKKYPETRSSSSSGPLETEHIDKRRKTDEISDGKYLKLYCIFLKKK
jgi:hypothetical protein